MKYVYPAVFTQDGDQILVSVPDLKGCHTFGENLQEAIEMARDAISMWLCMAEDRGEEIPTPSMDIQSGGGFVSYVDVDTTSYRKLTNPMSVKKTLSIPGYLNAMAESRGINFSAVLQEALKQRLQL